MKNLLTEKDIVQSPFFQLPKDLFHSLSYRSMRLESKVAYTILLDLLPLSIQNRWVNEKGEVFVKLSRKKLMALLGIKGTQKMAQVIMRGVIRKLKMHHIEHLVDQFRQVTATTQILNPKRYIQTMIYNSIYEANASMLGHIRYHFGYC